jgi:hypothetical protein
VGISKERVHYIVTEELGMKKLAAMWVPRLLTGPKRGAHQVIQGQYEKFKTQ